MIVICEDNANEVARQGLRRIYLASRNRKVGPIGRRSPRRYYKLISVSSALGLSQKERDIMLRAMGLAFYYVIARTERVLVVAMHSIVLLDRLTST